MFRLLEMVEGVSLEDGKALYKRVVQIAQGKASVYAAVTFHSD